MLTDDATSWFAVDPVFLLVPGLVLAATGSAFLLLADGLRRGLRSAPVLPATRSPRNRQAKR
ncbi:hypothetical protein [Paractinoplanes hotanensis]|uniref:Uncharacterized protein n=1 Tax=Paractinoplanes hotanensis TaxID=2906497 RepID=A0ABT0Y8W7_9ACTN|nr:hypothetical protein [Actinoplanes hotanensis]MCM4082493.1 hypothetical protein [Actinoplanes hotanensis]